VITSPPVAESHSKPKRILVVDDEEDVQVLVCRILRDVGYEVDSASDGGEAIEKIGHRKPDLLVLDLMMPGIDGWGVLEHLRKMPDAPPVVVVTARADYSSFARGVREGASAYVFKPFRFHELVATCQKVLLSGVRRTVSEERRKRERRNLMVDVKVLSKDRAGFIVNWLLMPYLNSAVRMLEEGFASREDIDQAVVLGLAHPMGPLQLLDLIGLDTALYISEVLFDEFKDPLYAPPPLLKRMVTAGYLGRKSRHGFYTYD